MWHLECILDTFHLKTCPLLLALNKCDIFLMYKCAQKPLLVSLCIWWCLKCGDVYSNNSLRKPVVIAVGLTFEEKEALKSEL